jgi:hypothetical protein
MKTRKSIKNVLAVSRTHAMIPAEKTIASAKDLLNAKLGTYISGLANAWRVSLIEEHSIASADKSERAGFCVAVV